MREMLSPIHTTHNDIDIRNILHKNGVGILTDYGSASDFRASTTIKIPPSFDAQLLVTNGEIDQETLDKQLTIHQEEAMAEDYKHFIGVAYHVLSDGKAGIVLPDDYAQELSKQLQSHPEELRNQTIGLFTRYRQGDHSSALFTELKVLLSKITKKSA